MARPSSQLPLTLGFADTRAGAFWGGNANTLSVCSFPGTLSPAFSAGSFSVPSGSLRPLQSPEASHPQFVSVLIVLLSNLCSFVSSSL